MRVGTSPLMQQRESQKVGEEEKIGTHHPRLALQLPLKISRRGTHLLSKKLGLNQEFVKKKKTKLSDF